MKSSLLAASRLVVALALTACLAWNASPCRGASASAPTPTPTPDPHAMSAALETGLPPEPVAALGAIVPPEKPRPAPARPTPEPAARSNALDRPTTVPLALPSPTVVAAALPSSPTPAATPSVTPPAATPAHSPAAAATPTPATGAVDLNSAPAAELARLPGLDINRANLIIAHRKAIRGFRRPDQLREVYGISEKIFFRLLPLVTVGPYTPPPPVDLPPEPLPAPLTRPGAQPPAMPGTMAVPTLPHPTPDASEPDENVPVLPFIEAPKNSGEKAAPSIPETRILVIPTPASSGTRRTR